MKLVVVGNGMVGQRFVEALRARDTEGRWEVTVLAEESRPAYDRVGLSAYFTGTSAEELSLVPEGFYDDAAEVTLRLGEPALSVDRVRRVVTTARGEYRYDALVLATGSYPFVPPVTGSDLPGCFVYRTLDDLEALADHCAGRHAGAVVGGGLLGLEAANALRLLGLRTHVVEFAPRLMPMQLDEAGGAMLRRHVEALGLTVHTATRTERLQAGPDGFVERMVFAADADAATGAADAGVTDAGSTDAAGPGIDVDTVVFAAGVRPRDDLARACGLEVGPRGGVVVDRTCRTSDPAVYAIGECANVDGQVHGLVAPGYAMAEVVAGRLLGGDDTFAAADTSTKLKLLGVDVASFGTPAGELDVVYSDPAHGIYAKLALTDDAQTLLGGILVGDASAYAVLRASVNGPLPGKLADFLGSGEVPGDLPGGAQVCSCHAVTKDDVLTAVGDGHTDVAGLKACTRAGTGCGSCVPLLRTLLAQAGVEQSRAMCEHFAYSRQELFDLVRVRELRSFSRIVQEFGTGRGCDVCKPAIASILASLGNGHILDGEQAALQDTNDRFLANLQRNGTYSVVPRIPGGEITPDKLLVIAEVARDFNLYTKITGAQRIDLLGARVEQLPLIWRRLVDAGMESGHAYGKAVRTVKSCVGTTWCRYGVQDSVSLAVNLELRYRGLRSPHKIKAAVSGCARECAEARGKDVGVIATENGWNLFVGGNGGFRPRHADLFATDLDTETLVRTIDRFLMFYVRTADRLQRTAAWIEGMDGGLDHLRSVIVDDALGICADLDAAMEHHVGSYSDEWAATLNDPEKLGRFVSFVNAPGTPDPSIEFVTQRGQAVPADAPVLVAGPTLATRTQREVDR
ncbi:nitrite reductase large subunit NirB [Actinopolymorpha singaporensis]|uniref:assimilatory sulfite reductase (ferredoxin) n=1 Tax=Actinopolymorpha singaporensis TaxID=117157 RepID=A0A1H1YZN9_9ACTN|nr:nitrite reductase large subunit NirB [Actinopolymorpha singaporensis]SDT27025.1 assimilatory nitrite reductase (NAD(P)H) large subunit precursor [Actinopolymorpha singaporensis]